MYLCILLMCTCTVYVQCMYIYSYISGQFM